MSDQDTFVNGIEIISTDLATSTSASLYSYGGISILTTTPATDIDNAGGLLVMGGSVLQKNLILGGNMTILDTIDSISASTGSIIISGGLGVKKTANINKLISSNVTITNLNISNAIISIATIGNLIIPNINAIYITSSNLNITGQSSMNNTLVTNITTQNINVTGTTSISNPVNSNDATTKLYVDNLLDGIQNYYSVDSGSIVSNISTLFILLTDMSLTNNLQGVYAIYFNCEYTIPDAYETVGFSTATAKSDLNLIYDDLSGLTPTATHALSFGGGETINPGVYLMIGAVAVSGNLTLDGLGNSNSRFVIRTTAAFDTAASSKVLMINSAQASNIYWVAQDAIGIGANTKIPGLIFSNSGAIAVGADCDLTGARLFTKSGAIAFGPGTLSLPTGAYTINLRSLANFIIFTGGGGIANTGTSVYTGDISTHLGAITGFSSAIVNGTIFQPGSTTVITQIYHFATFGLYLNNVYIPNSNRTKLHTSSDVSLQAVATLINGDTIEVRYKVDDQNSDNDGEVIVDNRILTMHKIN